MRVWLRSAFRSQRPLILGLLLCLLFELSLWVGVIASPFFQEWMPHPTLMGNDAESMVVRWRRSVARPDDDPAVGTRAPRLSLRSPTGERLEMAALTGKKASVLFVKDSSGCSTKALIEAWSRLQKEGSDRVVIVVAQQRDAGVEQCAREVGGTQVMLDLHGQTAKRYNARWVPRAYAIDEHGVLTYVQPVTTHDSQAPLAVERLWAADR